MHRSLGVDPRAAYQLLNENSSRILHVYMLASIVLVIMSYMTNHALWIVHMGFWWVLMAHECLSMLSMVCHGATWLSTWPFLAIWRGQPTRVAMRHDNLANWMLHMTRYHHVCSWIFMDHHGSSWLIMVRSQQGYSWLLALHGSSWRVLIIGVHG